MIPTFSPSSSSSSSSSSAANRVEKATSEFLIGPDWTMNIDICDSINSNHWLAKDVVKAVKKRLQHKNPKVQLLALTLLETMVKNCGDNVHFHIAERNILPEMVKIVKKRTDLHVRDKILVLLDAWQEAFGGPGGKHSQYYWVYDELRRSGVQFPPRSSNYTPIFTPPVTRPAPMYPEPGYGMPSNSSTRLDEAMAAEMENLSISSISSMRDVLDLLADMLQAVNPSDRSAVKDEVIVDLVERCRANQKKLMQMLTTTSDEKLLGQGLELNDSMQIVLARRDAIASGLPLPSQLMNVEPRSTETQNSTPKTAEVHAPSTASSTSASAPVLPVNGGQIDEEDDEDDDFAQLARRHSKTQSASPASTSMQSGEGIPQVNATNGMSSPETTSAVVSNALVPLDPPSTKEQDIIDFLTMTLSTQPPETPAPSMQEFPSANPCTPEPYVAPWAQPPPRSQQVQSQFQPQTRQVPHVQMQFQPNPSPAQHVQTQLQPEPPQPQLARSQFQPQPHQAQHVQSQFQPNPSQSQHVQTQFRPGPPQPQQVQTQMQPQPQFQPNGQAQSQLALQPRSHAQYGYPPPPWAPTPGYFSTPNPVSRPQFGYSTPWSGPNASSMPSQASRTLQHVQSFPANINRDVQAGNNPREAGQKPFIPSYKLFEELNILGGSDSRFSAKSNANTLSGSNGQSMIGGRK